ncbi:hypothetical protein M8J75_008892 [Diaphorina citri]|nr:hypothetical protein M8J75_008892 [Diaphorina citri]
MGPVDSAIELDFKGLCGSMSFPKLGGPRVDSAIELDFKGLCGSISILFVYDVTFFTGIMGHRTRGCNHNFSGYHTMYELSQQNYFGK